MKLEIIRFPVISAEQNQIDIYQSVRFENTCKKLPEQDLKVVEDEIDRNLMVDSQDRREPVTVK